MAVFLIKQSGSTPAITANMNILKSGELAYSYVTGDSDGGDRLFIGTDGNKPNGKAISVDVIGGKYFVDMLDHPKGQLTPSSAIITDGSNKINELYVDNVKIDGNTISTSSGNVILNPNGSSTVDVSSSKITNVDEPTVSTDAATKNYVDTLNVLDVSADFSSLGDGQLYSGEQLQIRGGFNTNTSKQDLAGGTKVSVNLNSDVLGLSSLTVDNLKLDGNTLSSTSGNLTIDPSPVGNTGTLIIAGNLQVDGTTTTINSTEMVIDDKNITLASGAANATAADSAGIRVDGANANIFYTSSNDKWNFNKDIVAPNLNVGGSFTSSTLTGKYLGFDSDLLASTTSGLPEGTNLYYTTARADSDAKNAISVEHFGFGSTTYNNTLGVITGVGASPSEIRSVFSAGGDMTYDSATGIFSIDVETVYTKANFDSDLGIANTGQLPEGTNLYYTTARFDSDLGATSTSGLPEGSNLYFTNERVDDRVAALLHAGEGIDLNYTDGANELDISVELASSLNPGIATFDSVDFLVTAGNVEIQTIDCGTY
jgi:hypothetical protein